MRKIVLSILIPVFAMSFAVPVSATPNLKDPHLARIESLSIDFVVNTSLADQSRRKYNLTAKVELKVLVHSNSLSGVSIDLVALTTDYPEGQCQFVSSDQKQGTPIWFNAGTTSGGIQTPTLPVLKNLTSTKKTRDWRVEIYNFSFPVGNNQSLRPCVTNFRVRSVYLIDEALHEKNIMVDYPGGPFYEFFTPPATEAERKLLPEFACPAKVVPDFQQVSVACAEYRDLPKKIVGFTEIEIEETIAAFKKSLTPTQLKIVQIDDRIEFLNSSNLKADIAMASASRSILQDKQELMATTEEAKKLIISARIQGNVTSISRLKSAIENAKTEISELTAARKTLLSSVPASSPSPTPKASSTVKKLQSIRCEKGEAVKKVMGYNPVCPKGYIKIG